METLILESPSMIQDNLQRLIHFNFLILWQYLSVPWENKKGTKKGEKEIKNLVEKIEGQRSLKKAKEVSANNQAHDLNHPNHDTSIEKPLRDDGYPQVTLTIVPVSAKTSTTYSLSSSPEVTITRPWSGTTSSIDACSLS
ncbi:hypothetical protein VNO77_30848 [Canavalia gladiata]|uniref:Uncharacterized protein n=1 Tax=Canavalia gladiata TaxID=3824 RepID=A0AAN9KNH7_CANGL